MLDFTDPRYYLFLPCALAAVLVARKGRPQVAVLLVLSWIFFVLAGGWAILLLLTTTVTDYVLGRLIASRESRTAKRALLAVGITSSLALLAIAKYSNFLIGNLNWLSDLVGRPLDVAPQPLLPMLAISFYTFESVSYLVDIYRGDVEPTRSLLDYAAFIAFFPHLVSGPIVRPREFLPQLRDRIAFKPENIVTGVTYIVYGLAQKLVIADSLAPFVQAVFDGDPVTQGLSTWAVFLGAAAFAVQIYCDFAGYTRIAIGSAKLFNLDLPENFDAPYFATSPRDFWKRWHMTLSKWLRDYLYIPLGGSRKGKVRTYVNLVLTMAIGGLWHGASWTFVIWGLFHGVLLALNHAWDKIRKPRLRISPWAVAIGSWVLTQYLVLLGWVFFRSGDVTTLAYITRKLLLLDGFSWSLHGVDQVLNYRYMLVILAVFPLIAVLSRMSGGAVVRISRARPLAWGATVASLVLAILILAPSGQVPFIYFQF